MTFYLGQAVHLRWESRSALLRMSKGWVLLARHSAHAYFRWHLFCVKGGSESLVRDRHIKRKRIKKKSYVKSHKEYDAQLELDSVKILAAMKRYRDAPKKPTSVALDETTIRELKQVARKHGIPYQVLIRVFILDGLDRIKKAA